MSKYIRLILCFLVFSDVSHAAVICISSPSPSKSIFESNTLKFTLLDPNGTGLLSAQADVSATDSAPFGHVAKTYAQADGIIVTSIHYLYGRPFEIADSTSGKELRLTSDPETSARLGSDCYKIGP